MTKVRRKWSFVVTLLALGLAGCAGGHHAPERAPADRRDGLRDERAAATTVDGVEHVVGRGQTLWRIAQTYGVDLDELARTNGIDDPSRIETGQRLFVPGAQAVLDVPVAPVPGAGRTSLLWPVRGGRVLSYFGAPRARHRHGGLDIAGDHGEPVLAAEDGEVVYSGSDMRGYGQMIILDHGDGLRTLYAHNSRLLVRRGTRVQRGQTIARVGRTGNASTDHCHFEVRLHGRPIDPLPLVGKGPS